MMVPAIAAVLLGALCVQVSAGKVFLVPILPYGPNNQMQALREAAALAAALDYPLITFGLMPHYTETDMNQVTRDVPRDAWKVDPSPFGVVDLDLVIDRSTLANTTELVSLKEAVEKHGWDGRLDRMLRFRDVDNIEYDLMHLYNRRVIDALDARMEDVENFQCSPADLERVKALTGGRQFVGVVTFRGAATNGVFNQDVAASMGTTPCSKAVVEIIMNLRMSRQMVSAAQKFVSRHVPQPFWGLQRFFSGSSSDSVPPPYIALHLRPWPDSCMTYWINAQGPLDPKVLDKECTDPQSGVGVPNLVRHVVSALVDQMVFAHWYKRLWRRQAYVFVMCHPRIRRRVASEMRRALLAFLEETTEEEVARGQNQFRGQLPGQDNGQGQQPGGLLEEEVASRHNAAVALLQALYLKSGEADRSRLFFMDQADLPRIFRNHPTAVNSLMALTEQQVCRDAHVFVGTDCSSMSHNVEQERMVLQMQDKWGKRALFATLSVGSEKHPRPRTGSEGAANSSAQLSV